VKED
jgi:ribosomal protein L37AE/L43A